MLPLRMEETSIVGDCHSPKRIHPILTSGLGSRVPSFVATGSKCELLHSIEPIPTDIVVSFVALGGVE